MLRDELLRSKNDEIATCLSRRKRKLSALYLATVGFGATEDPQYPQHEQAFLDANDLSKGRYFNEATLPPPIHARARLPDSNDPAISKADVASPTEGLHTNELQQRITPTLTQSGEITPNLPTPADATGLLESSVLTSPKTQNVAEASAVAESPSHTDQSAGASVPAPPLETNDRDGTETVRSRASKAVTGATSLDISSDSLPRKKQDTRPSLTLGSSHEHPPSPASSIDPYNNNTPVPVAASPDTSPAEEVTEETGAIDRLTLKNTRPTNGRSTVVPSTPDEQLRLEDAQSTHNKTTNGVSDMLSKETEKGVDREDTTDRMDIDEEPVPDNSEDAAQPGVKSAVGESLSPTAPMEATEDSTVETPIKKSVSIPPTQPGSTQPERMTTRVSSGALRHKSVSEILGETPRSYDKTHPTTPSEQRTPDSVARMRFKDRKEREKERSRLSTVVFPKQPNLQQDKPDPMDLTNRDLDAVAKLNEEQDYLFKLFLNRAYAPPRGTNLNTLLVSAHKTLSTGNHLLEYQEQMDVRTLRRIYALQNANRWPLRQLKRSVEPQRQGTHWDVVMDHAKWMRTDFREERKWKIAAAKSCADWCAEYVHSDEEHRSLLRVQAKVPSPISIEDAPKAVPSSPLEDTGDEAFGGGSHPTPDLVPSAEEESVSDGFNDEPRHELHDTVAPAAIFSLGSDEFNFSVDMTPAAEKLLDELPIYGPLQIAPGTNLPAFKLQPDSAWKTDLLPVSKFASAKICFHDKEPPRKRSRYDFSQYGNETDHRITELAPEQTNVALFRPENKTIRDRIHPGHSFRPPTEYPMPSIGFFESRSSSQWTYAEDDELRRLVKDYSYNWSLISSCLTPSSLFTSGAERRTPWECFERWVGLEGLPADMSKTQYFRAYHQRLETAQRTVLAQQQAAQQQQQQQQQQQGASAQPQPPVRRRTTQPLRVDRRRSSKHLALLDAMRKLAKKRETMLQKQQHASHLASLRKANEANQPKPPISSPAEFSRLKYDREMKLQERQEQYRQQMIAQQRASLQAQRSGQAPNQQPMMNAPGRTNANLPPTSNPGLPGGTPNGMANGLSAGANVNQGRPLPMQNMPGGNQPNGQIPNNIPMKMMPQGQMQQNPGSRPGLPIQTSLDNTRVIREANRLQEQQRLLQSRQGQPHPQQGQQQFHNQQFGQQGSPNMNMSNVNGTPNNAAMMAAMQNQGGMQSPSFPGNTPQGVSVPSPRMGQPNPLSSGVVPQISTLQSQIQRNNPTLPPEQVTKMATERLNQYQQQQQQQRLSQQAAINAAAGSINAGAVQNNYQVPHDTNFQTPSAPNMTNGGSGVQIPQNQGFSPMMRVPQPQQNRVGPTSSPAMNGAVNQPSRSATPQNQRSGSAQAGPVQGSSKSPHAAAAQTAT